MHNSINFFLDIRANFSQFINSTMSKESEDYKVQILKVMKSETSSNEGLPLLFYVKLKQGSEPIYLKYSILKEKYPMTLISFFESRSNIKQKTAEPDHISETSANQDSEEEDFSEEEESEEQDEVDDSHRKPIPSIKQSMPSKKVKFDQPAKSKKEVKQDKKKIKFQDNQSDEDENQKQREEEFQSVSPQKVNFDTKPVEKPEPPGPKTMEMFDYDELIKTLDMVDSVSPAIISSRLTEKIPTRNYTIDRGDRKESTNRAKKPLIESSKSQKKPQKSPNKQPAKKTNRK